MLVNNHAIKKTFSLDKQIQRNILDWVILGLNVSAVLSTLLRVTSSFHTSIPEAKPAAIAAPSAVVSGIDGRTEINNDMSSSLFLNKILFFINSFECQKSNNRRMDNIARLAVHDNDRERFAQKKTRWQHHHSWAAALQTWFKWSKTGENSTNWQVTT